MKSHLSIAQELYEEFLKDDEGIYEPRTEQHAQDCQMFLDFLKSEEIKDLVHDADLGASHELYYPIEEYKEDLQATLKFYKEKGVIEK